MIKTFPAESIALSAGNKVFIQFFVENNQNLRFYSPISTPSKKSQKSFPASDAKV